MSFHALSSTIIIHSLDVYPTVAWQRQIKCHRDGFSPTKKNILMTIRKKCERYLSTSRNIERLILSVAYKLT